MSSDTDMVTELVIEFCRRRGVADGSRFRMVANLDAAFDVLVMKGPDERWKTIASRACGDDFPETLPGNVGTLAERTVFDHAVRQYNRDNAAHLTRRAGAWCLKPVVVSAQHWSRLSTTIRTAHGLGLGWILPANKDVLLVPRPALRCAEDRPSVLHEDADRMAVEWADGSGYHFLRGCPFDPMLYSKTIDGTLSVSQIANLGNADQRSIALSYMPFENLVAAPGVTLLDVGAKGTALYALRLPDSIARDRVRGYGDVDYFIHMRDASHPEREFVEWVDPRIAASRNAELCQAHAFGITLSQWIAVEQEG
jgi:hypothetical protein